MSKIKQLVEGLKGTKGLFEANLAYESKAKLLQEVLIQFGKASDSKFGNIVILAGGAGSGKGFVLNNLLDIQGKVFDVDKLKEFAIDSKFIAGQILRQKGVDVKKLNLRNPDEVSKLHELVSALGLEKMWKNTMFQSVMLADPERKPNLIFDVTLKSPDKLFEIAEQVSELGYKKERIHIVWVVNDVEVAIQQNANRSRVVSDKILLLTHSGVANTIRTLLHPATRIRNEVDGKIVFAFNKAKVDSVVVTGDKKQSTVFNKEAKPFYIKEADYVVVKEVGKDPFVLDDIESKFLRKISEYIPANVADEWQRAYDRALGKDL